MSSDWENTFSSWAKPPSESEYVRCENAEKEIRNAINASDKLNRRDIKVFAQGSYKNNTNVRRNSDVDVAVLCYDTFFYDLPEGKSEEDFKISSSSYHYSQFKNEVGEALVSYFSVKSVIRGNKAFNIKENSYHVEADVAPFFEHRRYDNDGSHLSGVELRPDNNGRIINWPVQHYENGVRKNNNTNKRFKQLVRIIKSLCNEMLEKGISSAQLIPGFLNECLVWNVPDANFGHVTYKADVRACLAFLYNNTRTDEECREWGEVSELKYLFRPKQKWTREQAHVFISNAWDYIGFQ